MGRTDTPAANSNDITIYEYKLVDEMNEDFVKQANSLAMVGGWRMKYFVGHFLVGGNTDPLEHRMVAIMEREVK